VQKREWQGAIVGGMVMVVAVPIPRMEMGRIMLVGRSTANMAVIVAVIVAVGDDGAQG
jgi:hypothetical protein